MANTLSKSGISTTQTIEAWHVTQSIDALTGTKPYNISISGSLNITGSINTPPGTINNATASYAITASYAANAAESNFTATGISGSWQGATGSMTVLSSSFALTASFLEGSVTSASYASTASYAGQLFGSPSITVTDITSSGNISASGYAGSTINLVTDPVTISATRLTISSSNLTEHKANRHVFYEDGTQVLNLQNQTAEFSVNITSSGDISASGIITGATGSFTYLQGSSPINIISPLISNLNGTKIIEVTHSGDFPTPSGTQVTLEENTTYIIRGNVNMSDTLFVSGSAISLYGIDRNKDALTYTSSSTFITVKNSDFSMQNLKLSSTNTSSLILSGSDYTSGSYNQGRLKVMEINNCQFRNCGNVADFKGYDLVDINNTLFWYIQAPTIGLRFQDTSKTEVSSCEFIRWFDETSIPTPTGFAACPMVRFRENGAENAGFGAVNINTCVIHPQVQQDGISVSTGSTTGAGGTVSSNTFVAGNLTTGSLIAESSFDSGSILKWDFGLNQGVADSEVHGMGYFEGLTASQGSATYSLVGVNGAFSSSNFQRMSISSSGEMIYNGTKPIYVSIGAGVTFTSDGAGNHDFILYKSGSGFPNAELSGSRGGVVSIPNNDGASISISYSTTLDAGDKIGVYGKTTATGYELTNLKLSIKE